MILYFAILLGIIIATLFPTFDIRHIPSYETILYALLGMGLYGAVCGIDLKEFHTHRNIIFRAVTFGVLIKSCLVGGIMWLFFQTPYAFLFGIIVAQIDPLSVAHLLESKSSHFSTGGRTILRAWASFDDPMTVLLALYVFLNVVVAQSGNFLPQTYVVQIGLNIALAVVVWVINKYANPTNTYQILLLLAAFLFAVPFKLMLGIALVGLFLRPQIKKLDMLVHYAFIIAAVLLGLLVEINSVYFFYGIILGLSAFTAQIVVTFFVAPKLNPIDKLFLATAQYNGITSIILALIIAQWVPEMVSIIAFAVVTINSLYYGSNYFLNKHLQSTK